MSLLRPPSGYGCVCGRKFEDSLSRTAHSELCHVVAVYDERDRLLAENTKLKADIVRINGPFTCAHDPQFVGGACAACHAEALVFLDILKHALEYAHCDCGERDCCFKVARKEAQAARGPNSAEEDKK